MPPPPPATTSAPAAPSHPPRVAVKSPNRIVAETEQQWLFSDAELSNTPSIQDGMSQAEEKAIRAKGVNFIVQVGIMLKLPQLTLSTAAVFFQRFLMRASLKKERNGIPKLHHYQTAATALFLATKVEESCRKMRELILAFCRVAQKNPNLVIDEQSKDWWRWRDCILHNEDVLLEVLCFDLTVESPHKQLFEMLKWYGVEHNKRLRNAAWAFVTDSSNTMLCLLCSSRTIAVASLYAACRYHCVPLPDDAKGRPWWETQHVRLKEVRKAVEYMCANYEVASNKGADGSGNTSIYAAHDKPQVENGSKEDVKAEPLPSSQALPPSSAPGPGPPPKAEDPGEVSEEGELEE
ncbi:cyclin-like protein [Teratosphaeria nubilosa]|uniref:RNA polymerase II holoenzyme cyclin-like subunit n=1 Tax=Teratosphaeria nubilosa TaxID=161662 RepID=A0A6G1L1I3_9PEZI|nr:cyclin-like protein [Teratosphaeria nubilosa]